MCTVVGRMLNEVHTSLIQSTRMHLQSAYLASLSLSLRCFSANAHRANEAEEAETEDAEEVVAEEVEETRGEDEACADADVEATTALAECSSPRAVEMAAADGVDAVHGTDSTSAVRFSTTRSSGWWDACALDACLWKERW
jgi:hypothetical protein